MVEVLIIGEGSLPDWNLEGFDDQNGSWPSYVPTGTKEKALTKLLKGAGHEVVKMQPLVVKADLSPEEAAAWLSITKLGRFAEKWEEIKELEHNEFVQRLAKDVFLELVVNGV